jgi:hypothetical protein
MGLIFDSPIHFCVCVCVFLCGDLPQGDLATFGYRPAMKVKLY